MAKIRVLDSHTINKIAAGEVIENTASVIKELVENALDAGSTEISVEIKEGGRQLIRISDNGCGMSQEDAILCLERHATSKIINVEDIHDISTMGFRGEAIPSIASISKFTLLTTPRQEDRNDTNGVLIIVEGGTIITQASAARSAGTTIEVKSLFFNVPVRKKFQKSPSFDVQEILKMLTVLSLGHPHVKFELISDHKQILNNTLSPVEHSFQDKLGYRIENTLGKNFLTSLLPISFKDDLFQAEGFIGLPSFNRQNRTGQFLFINQRAIQSSLISFAIREGYGTALPVNRYPVFIMHIRLPGSLVDVNVHPQKKEVRLRQEQKLKACIIEAIQSAIQKNHFVSDFIHSPTPSVSSTPFPLTYTSSNMYEELLFPVEKDSEALLNERPAENYPPASQPSYPSFSAFEEQHTYKPSHSWAKQPTPFQNEPEQVFQFIPKVQQLNILATLPGYILIDPTTMPSHLTPLLSLKSQDGFCVINQKFAYSRLAYEKLIDQEIKDKESGSFIQTLLLPITLEFSALEASHLRDYLPELNKMGFGIQEFGNQTFKLDALPEFLKNEELESFLIAIIQDLREFQDSKRAQKEKEKFLAHTASKHAAHTRKRLTADEARMLIEQLSACQIPYQCPLGRPIFVHMSSEDLANLFMQGA